jgi:hypothetical protein
MAQSWRKPFCAVIVGALRKKHGADALRQCAFPHGAPMAHGAEKVLMMLQRTPRPDRRRAADRARQRRCRELRRQGRAAYSVVADADVLDMLVKLGWLRDGDATDPRRVGRAISALLADAANKCHA